MGIGKARADCEVKRLCEEILHDISMLVLAHSQVK